MNVLHILDHSPPAMRRSTSTRSRNIITFQRSLGLRPVVLTSPKHPLGPDCEMLEESALSHPHGPARAWLPYVGELALMVRLARRIREVAARRERRCSTRILRCSNGLPALWVGRRLRLPMVYRGARVLGGRRRPITGPPGGLPPLPADPGPQRPSCFGGQTASSSSPRPCAGRSSDAASSRPDRVAVVLNGVDTESRPRFHGTSSSPARQGLDGAPVLGFIGSFYHYEGLSLLRGISPALRDALRPALGCSWWVAGTRRRRSGDLLAGGNAVSVRGTRPYDRIRDYYSLIDVFRVPSRLRMRLTAELVTPLKLLEAMATARPVLASDVGGQAEADPLTT